MATVTQLESRKKGNERSKALIQNRITRSVHAVRGQRVRQSRCLHR
ncbi:Uncharacterised protein [Vibrio cholerae]|nr:Uncharacterised protein [Vibrio cholerae]CSI45169.1 Uncharacterised protein [Vibrio cholerae]